MLRNKINYLKIAILALIIYLEELIPIKDKVILEK
jgi:hypothetical protein